LLLSLARLEGGEVLSPPGGGATDVLTVQSFRWFAKVLQTNAQRVRVPSTVVPFLVSSMQRGTNEVVCREVMAALHAVLPSPGAFDALSLHGKALFLRYAMLNHSCAPSASVFSPKVAECASVTVVAGGEGGPIQAGAEITINYIRDQPGELTIEQRKLLLSKSWGFQCTCSVCEGCI
jgi:hypothetical protein